MNNSVVELRSLLRNIEVKNSLWKEVEKLEKLSNAPKKPKVFEDIDTLFDIFIVILKSAIIALGITIGVFLLSAIIVYITCIFSDINNVIAQYSLKIIYYIFFIFENFISLFWGNSFSSSDNFLSVFADIKNIDWLLIVQYMLKSTIGIVAFTMAIVMIIELIIINNEYKGKHKKWQLKYNEWQSLRQKDSRSDEEIKSLIKTKESERYNTVRLIQSSEVLAEEYKEKEVIIELIKYLESGRCYTIDKALKIFKDDDEERLKKEIDVEIEKIQSEWRVKRLKKEISKELMCLLIMQENTNKYKSKIYGSKLAKSRNKFKYDYYSKRTSFFLTFFMLSQEELTSQYIGKLISALEKGHANTDFSAKIFVRNQENKAVEKQRNIQVKKSIVEIALDDVRRQTGKLFSNYNGLDTHYCAGCRGNVAMRRYSKFPHLRVAIGTLIAPLPPFAPDPNDYLWICPKCGWWSINM